jgi:hypothetical protein
MAKATGNVACPRPTLSPTSKSTFFDSLMRSVSRSQRSREMRAPGTNEWNAFVKTYVDTLTRTMISARQRGVSRPSRNN